VRHVKSDFLRFTIKAVLLWLLIVVPVNLAYPLQPVSALTTGVATLTLEVSLIFMLIKKVKDTKKGLTTR
jgi:hypothetical protein